MRRPHLARSASAVLLASLTVASACTSSDEPARPNVLVIVTDDQPMALFDRELMPGVHRRLVDRGVLFERGYVSTPQCCPSRAQILTGLYQHRNGVVRNGDPLERDTIVSALRSAGYRTMMAGKYLQSARCEPSEEFDRWWCAGGGPANASLEDPKLVQDGEMVKLEGLTMDILADGVGEFVAEEPGRPFFVWFAPIAPHLPADDPRYASMDVAVPRRASFNQAIRGAGVPRHMKAEPLGAQERAEVDALFRRMARSVRAMDDSIGRLLDRIEQHENDTLVFFLSDNGQLFGEHRRTGKGVPYEETVNVPFVVRLPGGETGATPALVANVDIAATIADVAGVRWPSNGRSLLPLLEGRADGVRRDVLITGCAADATVCPGGIIGGKGRLQLAGYRGLVTPRWKYVEYVTGERELYDLAADRLETTNLAEDDRLEQVRAELARRLEDAWTSRPTAP